MRVLRTTWWLGAQLAVVLTVGLLGLVAAFTVAQPTRVGPDVLRLVGGAGQAAEATGSYRMELSFTVDGPGDAIEVAGTADLDAATGESTGRIGLPDGGQLAFLTVGNRGYFELPAASPLRLGSKRWVGFPLLAEQALTADPLVFLRLIAKGGEVRQLGSDKIRGVESTHYRARLDVAEVARLAAEQQGSAVLPAEALALLKGGRADAWISDDGLPRRLRVQLEADGLDVELGFDLFEFGVDVRPVAPPDAEVIVVPTQQEAVRFLSGR
jgi:hypothetical protein